MASRKSSPTRCQSPRRADPSASHADALLDVLLPREGVDAAIKAREAGKDVSRKLGKDAGLPDNMSALERNSVIDAIIESRKAEVKPQNEQTINEASGGTDAPADAKVITADLSGKPAEQTTTEVKPNEAGNGANEAPARPTEGAAGKPQAAEVGKTETTEPPRAEAPDTGVVEPGKSPDTAAPSAATPAPKRRLPAPKRPRSSPRTARSPA